MRDPKRDSFKQTDRLGATDSYFFPFLFLVKLAFTLENAVEKGKKLDVWAKNKIVRELIICQKARGPLEAIWIKLHQFEYLTNQEKNFDEWWAGFDPVPGKPNYFTFKPGPKPFRLPDAKSKEWFKMFKDGGELKISFFNLYKVSMTSSKLNRTYYYKEDGYEGAEFPRC